MEEVVVVVETKEEEERCLALSKSGAPPQTWIHCDDAKEVKEVKEEVVEGAHDLHEVLTDGHFLDLFEDFCDKKLCGENIRFWRELMEFKRDIKELIATFGDTYKGVEVQMLNHPINKKVILECIRRHLENLYNCYFKPFSVNELNIDEDLKHKTISAIEHRLHSEPFSQQESPGEAPLTIELLLDYLRLFDNVEWSIKELISSNCFQAFTRTEAYRKFRANKNKQTLLRKLNMMPSFYVTKCKSPSIPTLSTPPNTSGAPPFLRKSPRAFSSVPNICISSDTPTVCAPNFQKTTSTNELLVISSQLRGGNTSCPSVVSPDPSSNTLLPRNISVPSHIGESSSSNGSKPYKRNRSSSITEMINLATTTLEKKLQQKHKKKQEKSDSASVLSLLQSPNFPEFNLKVEMMFGY